jgi:fumarate reductase flavoprotein subunit
MYRYHTPSGDKSCDGMAMALRAGLSLRDMEMVQFHPTGLLAGPDTRMTGTVLEEGLRGAGGYLLNGAGERFMFNYHDHGERATRDVVSRSIYGEMRDGRTTPLGGVYIEMKHLGPEFVANKFKGMVKRCADSGFDLAGDRVEVVPTAHYMMGGIEMELDTATAIAGLFVAGEDAGGVHGANRLGGNGVANSTVYGGISGEVMANFVAGCNGVFREPDMGVAEAAIEASLTPFGAKAGGLYQLRSRLDDLMWDKVGIIREAGEMRAALAELDDMTAELDACGIPDTGREFNITWHDWLNLESLLLVSKSIAVAALARDDSRGAHYRSDFPDAGPLEKTTFTVVTMAADGAMEPEMKPVDFTIVKPGESLIEGEAGAPPGP